MKEGVVNVSAQERRHVHALLTHLGSNTRHDAFGVNKKKEKCSVKAKDFTDDQ